MIWEIIDRKASVKNGCVLILILLEDDLGVLFEYSIKTYVIVLILILLEDDLGGLFLLIAVVQLITITSLMFCHTNGRKTMFFTGVQR